MSDQCAEIAIAVVRRGDQFLVGRRPAGVPLAGFWEFPGGKIHPGETSAAAAARECLEEAGISVEVGEQCLEIAHRYEHGQVRLHFFACRATSPDAFPCEPFPCEPFRWVSAAELQRLEFPPANAELLAMLARQHAAQRSC